MLIAFSQLPPAPPPALPPACLPFDPAWQVHNLGYLNIRCPDCGALHWLDECLSKSSILSQFGMCCYQGKVLLPPIQPPPIELYRLLTSQEPPAKKFCQHICNYKNALAMTSVGRESWMTLSIGRVVVPILLGFMVRSFTELALCCLQKARLLFLPSCTSMTMLSRPMSIVLQMPSMPLWTLALCVSCKTCSGAHILVLPTTSRPIS